MGIVNGAKLDSARIEGSNMLDLLYSSLTLQIPFIKVPDNRHYSSALGASFVFRLHGAMSWYHPSQMRLASARNIEPIKTSCFDANNADD